MNPVHVDGVNLRRGPSACFESRTNTRRDSMATSRQLSLPELALLLRQAVLVASAGVDKSWLCSTHGSRRLVPTQDEPSSVTVVIENNSNQWYRRCSTVVGVIFGARVAISRTIR